MYREGFYYCSLKGSFKRFENFWHAFCQPLVNISGEIETSQNLEEKKSYKNAFFLPLSLQSSPLYPLIFLIFHKIRSITLILMKDMDITKCTFVFVYFKTNLSRCEKNRGTRNYVGSKNKTCAIQ